MYIKFILSILKDRIDFTKIGFGEILARERRVKGPSVVSALGELGD